MVSDCPCLFWEATTIEMASGTLQVDPITRVVALAMGIQKSLGEGK